MLNKELLSEWARRNGGIAAFNPLIESRDLSYSSADKLYRAKYPNTPGPRLQIKLVELTGIQESKLFPEVAASKKHKAS